MWEDDNLGVCDSSVEITMNKWLSPFLISLGRLFRHQTQILPHFSVVLVKEKTFQSQLLLKTHCSKRRKISNSGINDESRKRQFFWNEWIRRITRVWEFVILVWKSIGKLQKLKLLFLFNAIFFKWLMARTVAACVCLCLLVVCWFDDDVHQACNCDANFKLFCPWWSAAGSAN